MSRLTGYLRLMRPANIVTAVSDILAGDAIAGYFLSNEMNQLTLSPVLFLILSTIGLYGGGVVFNDVFDAELDAVERPERPIPGGLVKKEEAALLGILLLAGGIIAAFFVHWSFMPSGILALAIAAAAVLYDKWGKHRTVLGPINMGLCRGLNLLLGMSVVPEVIFSYWYIALIPVLYIAAITMISRGEVHGGRKNTLYTAALFYGIVIACIAVVSVLNYALVYSILFIMLFAVMIFLPLRKAMQNPQGPLIGKAVKAGVISLIMMNAAWAASFQNLYLALVIVLLLPLSIWVAKAFAVT